MYVYVELLNGNKYYRGLGENKSNTYENIETNSTPVDDIESKKQYYKLKEIVTYKKQIVNNIDAKGNIINTYEINIPTKAYGWKFDNIAWENSGTIVEPSETERIESLEQGNEALTHRVSTLQEVNATQESVINNLVDENVEMSDLILTLSMQMLN